MWVLGASRDWWNFWEELCKMNALVSVLIVRPVSGHIRVSFQQEVRQPWESPPAGMRQGHHAWSLLALELHEPGLSPWSLEIWVAWFSHARQGLGIVNHQGMCIELIILDTFFFPLGNKKVVFYLKLVGGFGRWGERQKVWISLLSLNYSLGFGVWFFALLDK